MNVYPLKDPKSPIFGDLELGDTYRTENGESIYMKVSGNKFNAVAIDTGFTFNHRDNYSVRPVSGAFHEE